MEYQIREENKKMEEEREKLKNSRDLIYDFFYNKNFHTLLTFLVFYNLIEVLKFVERFHWVDLISIVSSIFVLVGLIGFYNEMKIKSSINQSLGLTITFINILFVISLIGVVLFVYALLPFITKATFAFIITIILVGVMILNLQALYYTSRSLYIIRNLVDNGKIETQTNEYYFSKAASKWVISGLINAFIFILSLMNSDFKAETNVQSFNYRELISLGGFSKVVHIIGIIITLLFPFIISSTLDATKVGLKKIHNRLNEK